MEAFQCPKPAKSERRRDKAGHWMNGTRLVKASVVMFCENGLQKHSDRTLLRKDTPGLFHFFHHRFCNVPCPLSVSGHTSFEKFTVNNTRQDLSSPSVIKWKRTRNQKHNLSAHMSNSRLLVNDFILDSLVLQCSILWLPNVYSSHACKSIKFA